MTILNENKPPIGELVHYGVLGMKWGKTRAKASAAEIRGARGRLSTERAKLAKQETKVGKARDAQQLKSEQKKLAQMRSSYLKNPDRVVAARMTRGEKVVTLLILGVTPVGVGAVAATSARSRRIEQKQDKKKYD